MRDVIKATHTVLYYRVVVTRYPMIEFRIISLSGLFQSNMKQPAVARIVLYSTVGP